MRILGVAVVAMMMAAGCGGGGDEDRLTGGWAAELGTSGCILGLNLDVGAKTYVAQMICRLAGGTYGDEIEGGDADFSVQGQIAMVPRRASCLTSDHSTETAGYTFSGENLGMAYAQGLIVFQPNNAMGGASGVAQFGCFDPDAFRAHPIQNL